MSQDTLYNDGVLDAGDNVNCATTEFAEVMQRSMHRGHGVKVMGSSLVFCLFKTQSIN